MLIRQRGSLVMDHHGLPKYATSSSAARLGSLALRQDDDHLDIHQYQEVHRFRYGDNIYLWQHLLRKGMDKMYTYSVSKQVGVVDLYVHRCVTGLHGRRPTQDNLQE